MIDRDTYHWIHFYSEQQKLGVGQTAAKLGISESTVRRHLAESGYEGRKAREVPSVLDEFEPIIGKMLSSNSILLLARRRRRISARAAPSAARTPSDACPCS